MLYIYIYIYIYVYIYFKKNNETGHIGLYIYFYPVTHFWNFQKHEKN